MERHKFTVKLLEEQRDKNIQDIQKKTDDVKMKNIC